MFIKNHKKLSLAILLGLVSLILILPIISAFADESTWTICTPMSVARGGLKTETMDGKIYAIGGYNASDGWLSSAEVYDPASGTWTTLASMAVARRHLDTEVIDGKIYAIGGINSNGQLSSAEVYDPNTNTWTTLSSMSAAREYFQTEVIDGIIYAIGGGGLSSVEAYDPGTNTWTTLSSMSVARMSFQTEVISGKIYAIGGVAPNSVYLSSAEVYDPNTNTWTTLAPMTSARYGLETQVIDGKIYAIGGYNSSDGCLSLTEVYDPDTNAWTELTSMPIAKSFSGITTIDGKIYVIGGRNTVGTDPSYFESSCEIYDPGSDSWSAMASMSTARQLAQIEIINGTIYAIGSDNLTALSLVESYSLAPDAPANLTATAGDSQVSLAWDSVSDADSYTVMRATTSGGDYASIAAGVTSASYTDTGVTSGITYYYVVVAVNGNGVSAYSNEAFATPTEVTPTPTAEPTAEPTAAPTASYNSALLRITMVTGETKEYEMTPAEITTFITWFDSEGSDSPTYSIEKDYNIGPFSAREEYIVYDKISSFEVMEY